MERVLLGMYVLVGDTRMRPLLEVHPRLKRGATCRGYVAVIPLDGREIVFTFTWKVPDGEALHISADDKWRKGQRVALAAQPSSGSKLT